MTLQDGGPSHTFINERRAQVPTTFRDLATDILALAVFPPEDPTLQQCRVIWAVHLTAARSRGDDRAVAGLVKVQSLLSECRDVPGGGL